MKLAATILLGLLSTAVAFDILPRSLGQFAVDRPAFVQLFRLGDPAADVRDQYTLFISNFNPVAILQADYIYNVKAPGRILDSVSTWEAAIIDHTNVWPNDVAYLPSSVVGREGIIWTSGFLEPTKTKGRLNIYFTDTDPYEGPYNIAELDDQDYSYHRVIFKDLNNDGLQDVITCRFHTGLLGGTTKQTLWLENPGNNVLTSWPQHLVLEGAADIHFQVEQISAAGVTYDVQINAEFFNKKISLYYAENNANFWADPSLLIQVDVDANSGQPFDVIYGDFNLDGKKEILATAFDGSVGYVYVYLVPDDFRTGTFERITIADGFEPNFIITGNAMSPGSPHPFYVSAEHEASGEKPYIIVSGDDDGKHYILTPNSQDPNDWTYTKNLLVETGATTSGKYAVADIDGDGYSEVIAAGYSAGQVYVYTYAP